MCAKLCNGYCIFINISNSQMPAGTCGFHSSNWTLPNAKITITHNYLLPSDTPQHFSEFGADFCFKH